MLHRGGAVPHCASSHPVGCLLSGGLDSSSIVATARQLRPRWTRSSIRSRPSSRACRPPTCRRIDERAYVDAVVAQGGLDAHYVRGDLVSPLTDVDRVLWHLDEAFAAPNLYLHWASVRSRPRPRRQGAARWDRRRHDGLPRTRAPARSSRAREGSGRWAASCARSRGATTLGRAISSGSSRSSHSFRFRCVRASTTPGTRCRRALAPHGHQARVRQADGRRRATRGHRARAGTAGALRSRGPCARDAIRTHPVRPGNGRQGGRRVRGRAPLSVLRSAADGVLPGAAGRPEAARWVVSRCDATRHGRPPAR